MATYGGSCHCGRVTFEVTADIKELYECNCSICHRKGALYVSALASDQVCILGGGSELTVYQFGTGAASHQFCRHCGIHPFHHPRARPDGWTRCLPLVEPVCLWTGSPWLSTWLSTPP